MDDKLDNTIDTIYKVLKECKYNENSVCERIEKIYQRRLKRNFDNKTNEKD